MEAGWVSGRLYSGRLRRGADSRRVRKVMTKYVERLRSVRGGGQHMGHLTLLALRLAMGRWFVVMLSGVRSGGALLVSGASTRRSTPPPVL